MYCRNFVNFRRFVYILCEIILFIIKLEWLEEKGVGNIVDK